MPPPLFNSVYRDEHFPSAVLSRHGLPSVGKLITFDCWEEKNKGFRRCDHQPCYFARESESGKFPLTAKLVSEIADATKALFMRKVIHSPELERTLLRFDAAGKI